MESDTTNFVVDPIDSKSDMNNDIYNGEDLVDVGTGRVFLLPGDLVEIAWVIFCFILLRCTNWELTGVLIANKSSSRYTFVKSIPSLNFIL